MESIINNIQKLFSTYGFKGGLIIVATIILTNIIKKPIIKKATQFAEKTGYSKSIVTKNISILPILITYVLVFVFDLVAAKFKIGLLSFSEISAQAVFYAAVSVATYEIVKKQLEAYASKTKDKTSMVEVEAEAEAEAEENKKEGIKNEELL